MTKIIGVIFCQVNKIKQFNQFNPSITSGNQKWKGDIPIFVSNAELNIIIIVFSILFKIIKFFDIKIKVNSKMIEAKAWVRKYFKDLSDE